MTKESEEPKSDEAKQREMFNEAVAKFSRAASVGSPTMLAALLEGASQHMIATMMRTQLERIADAMELEILLVFMRDIVSKGTGPLSEGEERVVQARSFLRDKILTRIEREKMAEAGRAATVAPGFDPRGMCPGGCGRKAIDGKRTCGDASCGRTTP